LEQAIWVGYGLLAVSCWVLGFQALGAARRSRSPVDWALAAVVMFAGGFGCPLSFLPSVWALEPAQKAHVLALGIGGLGVASIALYLALWRHFRPRSMLAALVCSAGTFAIVWSLLAEVATAGFAWGRDRRWLALGGIACWIPYAWGAFEMAIEARRGHNADRRDVERSPQSYGLYSVALTAVALVYPFGLVSAYRNPGGPHPRAVVAAVAVVGFAGAIAATIGFYRGSRRVSSSRSPAEGASASEARSSARSS
jgi:hypothetical protein